MRSENLDWACHLTLKRYELSWLNTGITNTAFDVRYHHIRWSILCEHKWRMVHQVLLVRSCIDRFMTGHHSKFRSTSPHLLKLIENRTGCKLQVSLQAMAWADFIFIPAQLGGNKQRHYFAVESFDSDEITHIWWSWSHFNSQKKCFYIKNSSKYKASRRPPI